MSARRGADIVAEALAHLGVTRVFALSGNHVMPIFDALLSTDIEIVHVRQEAACVHMADAWGRLTGDIGVALVTGGQGHANGAAALFTALAAESPVLLLSGHAGLRELGRGGFQELAQADVARPMCKAAWTAASVGTLAEDVTRAARIAREGRPGPVNLNLPVDLLEAPVDRDTVVLSNVSAAAARPADSALIEATIQHLRGAERPLILCGPSTCGVSGRRAMRALEDMSGWPVIGMESPRGLNDPGLGGFAELVAAADLIVLVGKPLDFTLKFGDAPAVSSGARFVVIDPDPALVARAWRAVPERLLACGIGDSAQVLAQLTAGLAGAPARRAAWAGRVADALAYQPPDWASAKGTQGRLHPVELCRAVNAFLERHPGGTLICDGGEIGQWPQALIRPERRLINGTSGTIGASIPFAIAAKIRSPDAPVVAVLGDGTFGFHMAEFDTAVRYGLPIIAVVGNDARWNAEYQIQVRNYGRERARHCELLPTRYDEVVTALGGFGALATTRSELSDALERAHASGKPACVNAMIEGVPAPTIRRTE